MEEDLQDLVLRKTTKKKIVEFHDKSAPVIDSEIKIKKIDRNELLNEVAQEHDLKHADTVDKSAPVIENVSIKKVDRQAFLNSIEKGPDAPLHKPASSADRSSPVVARKSGTDKICAKCGKVVYPLEAIQACDTWYHKGCFRCKHCDGALTLKNFAAIANEPYCKPHYQQLFKEKGSYDNIAGSLKEGASSSFSPTFKGVK